LGYVQDVDVGRKEGLRLSGSSGLAHDAKITAELAEEGEEKMASRI
jgi:hypothetical protein